MADSNSKEQESSCLNDRDGIKHPTNDLMDSNLADCVVYPNNKSTLQASFAAFKEAEDYIKRSEISVGDLDIPSVNELRYFGYHLTKALSNSQSEEDQLEEIKKAKKHANRASYDAIELGLISNLEIIADFHSEFSSKYYLIDVFPTYAEKMGRVEEIKNLVGQESREDRGGNCQHTCRLS